MAPRRSGLPGAKEERKEADRSKGRREIPGHFRGLVQSRLLLAASGLAQLL